jgi:hypothetical protein
MARLASGTVLIGLTGLGARHAIRMLIFGVAELNQLFCEVRDEDSDS